MAFEDARHLQAELRAARTAASQADDAAKVAQAEAQRLRKTLINAELELQQASVTNDALCHQLQVPFINSYSWQLVIVCIRHLLKSPLLCWLVYSTFAECQSMPLALLSRRGRFCCDVWSVVGSVREPQLNSKP